MYQQILAGAVLALVAATSHAALLGRVPLTPGGTDYQAYFDTDLGITWTADANLPAANAFGIQLIDPDGRMNWDQAQAWVRGMNAASYLGAGEWRLPNRLDPGDFYCDPATSDAYSCQPRTDDDSGELARLYFNSLGNPGPPCSDSGGQPPCFENSGPFSNIQTSTHYFYGTDFPSEPYGADRIWTYQFRFAQGRNDWDIKRSTGFAWAVHDGDISAVPIPATSWLIAPAFGLLAPWVKRTAKSAA